jgi:hypothetical protein
MSTIIHYQIKLQTPFCYDGRTENVAFNLSQVTCKNCLEKKRREQVNSRVDWQAIKRDIESKLPVAKLQVKEFCLAHGYKGSADLASYPPRISVEIYILAGRDKRRKTVAHNIGVLASEPTYIQIYMPTDDDLDCIATFIGELGQSLGLRSFRKRGTDTAPLEYDLKAVYESRKVS